MQDDQGPMFRRETCESVVQGVTVGEGRDRIVAARHIDRRDVDLDHPSSPAACLVDRGVGQQSIEPGIEPIRIAQSGKVAPGPDECLLDCVARVLAVEEDQAGGRVQARRGCPCEHSERVAIASPCPLDENPLVHVSPQDDARIWRIY